MTLLLTCCSGETPEQTASDRLTTTTWEFALENNPQDQRGKRFFFNPGQLLTTDGDSVVINNGFLGRMRRYPVFGTTPTDSTISIGFTPTPLGGMEVSKYENDSLVHSAIFYPQTSNTTRVAHAELVGKTYWLKPEDETPIRVYFGDNPNIRIGSRQVTAFFVTGIGPIDSDKSFLDTQGGGSWNSHSYWPKPLYAGYYLRSRSPYLSRTSSAIIRTPEGELFAATIVAEEERYVEKRAKMELIPPIIPEEVDITSFTDLINYGQVKVDVRYAAPDSADVSYAYETDFLRFGVTLEEVQDLEFNYSPLDGSYNTFVRKRKLDGGKWEFSEDRNNLLHFTTEGRLMEALPIMGYTGDAVEFRLPLSIKTREPRGVELTSYAHVDAHVRVEQPAAATK